MPIEFNCESCSKLLRVPDGSGGKQCQCPGCSQVLNIPVPKVDAGQFDSLANMRSPSNGTDIALCIPCPKCKHELICDPILVGTKGQCRSCKHIFVISDFPSDPSLSSDTAINWVFSCPKCSQLFEGSEAMRGRKGKCHACGEVFAIELQVADDEHFESPAGKTPESPCRSVSSYSSFDDDLTLDVLPKETKASPEPTPPARKPTTSRETVVSKVSRSDLRTIQFNCSSCRGRMEVPGEAAYQLTHCPHCKRQLTVPSESEPTSEALAAQDPWACLAPPGSALTHMPQSSPFGDTQYPPPMTKSSMPAPVTSGARRPNGGEHGPYVACGIAVSICASLAIVLELLLIVFTTTILMRPSIDLTEALSQIFAASLAFIFSTVQLVGGIALARRSSLYTARTGAIICCLPCLCVVLNVPFGIWACILTFSQNAERDFR